jgi:predicted dehydrogenase
MSQEDVSRRGFIRAASTSLLAAAVPTTQLAPPGKEPPDLKIPKSQSKVGYAIVGLGKLAVEEILPAFGASKRSRPTALVSGHPEKARQLASVYDVDPKKIYSYDNYDKLADDPDVQIVYNVLPNHMHAEFTIRALKAGKHVLCEKPMCATVDEARQMCDAAKQANKQLMIAYRLHYEPFNLKARELVQQGGMGRVRLIETQNGQNTQAPNIRLSKQTAGGPLGDVGVYCQNTIRFVLGKEPIEVSAEAYQPADDPRFAEVYEHIVWRMTFPDGVIANCSASFGSETSRFYRVTCEKGYLELENAFGYEGQELYTKLEGKLSKHEINSVDHFAAEMDHFSECIQQNKPNRTPGEEGLKDMIIMDAIFRSVNERRPVKVELNV